MKKAVWQIFLALGCVTVTLSACIPAPKAIPVASTPSSLPATNTPKPTSTVKPTLTNTPLEPNQFSISNTQIVEFIGKKFELKFKATDQPVQIYEYYIQSESPSNWIELVDFQINPVNREGNTPQDFADGITAVITQKYPGSQHTSLNDTTSDAVILEVLIPASSHME